MVGQPTSRRRLVPLVLVHVSLAVLMVLGLPSSAAAAGFPRLGSIWPASATPNALLAKHDYVVLGRYEKSKIPALKSLNPDILLLTTDNAIEIAHEEISKYPAEWLLTQVGSSLTSAVSATANTLPVAATTAGTKKLFVAGDLVVIGSEVAVVQSVAANSITVKRGAWRPAQSHPAGTRAAATLTYWPGTVTMDMSTYCPKVTVDAATGPETYAENKARTSAARVADAAWDGIYVDRTDGNQSYLVTSTFTPVSGRTIDPARTNALVSDGYAAFDSAWNAGLRVYLSGLRTRIGQNKVILGNGAVPYFDLLNGTAFERFPNASGGIAGISWRDAVFTPDVRWSIATGQGSYTQWSTMARQPNLTTVGTYQNDNGGPDGKTPDYRNLRFSLTTALMGDGCLAYWLSHDNSTVLWFDEYDAAGRGTGYLGQPLGDAHPAHPDLKTPDLLSGDGAFDTAAQLNAWKIVSSAGYAATKTLDTVQKASGTGSARIEVTQAPGELWRANLQHTVAIQQNQPYTLTFKARADRPLSLTAFLERSTGTGVSHTQFGTVNLTTQWQTFELPATPTGSDAAAKLILGFGGKPATLYLDDVQVRAGNQRDVMRRDFEHGIALVNATDRSTTVDLGGRFRKIKGTQAPAVNDGALVSSVTLPPMDGIVLLRDETDTTPPTTPAGVIASAIDANAVFVTWNPSLDAGGVASYRVYTNGMLAATVGGTSATVGNLAQGTTYAITVQAVDNAGNVSLASVPASVTTRPAPDTTGPAITGLLSLTHPLEDTWYANAGPVTFSWAQSVDPSGVVGYSTSWSTNPLVLPANSVDLAPSSLTTKSYPAPVANGVWYFKVKALDGAGNWGPITTRVARVDTKTPSGSLKLNGGVAYTATTKVTAASTVDFGASGSFQMRFDTGSGFGAWQPFSAESTLVLSGGDGLKTVKAEFRNGAGSVSLPNTIVSTITLDTATPAITNLTSSHGASGVWSSNRSATFSWGSSTPASGYSYTWSQQAGVSPDEIVDTTSGSLSRTASADGIWYLAVRARSLAGTWGPTSTLAIRVDATAPSGNILLAEGSEYVATPDVRVSNLVDFGPSGAHPTQAMRFSLNGVDWSPWQTYSPTHDLSLVGDDGEKTVMAQFRDVAGNTSSVGAFHDSVVLDTRVPSVMNLARLLPQEDRAAPDPRLLQFVWDVDAGPSDTAGYSYTFSKTKTTLPDETIDTTRPNASLAASSEGEWWFSVRAKSSAGVWGPPESLRIEVKAEEVVLTETLTICPDDAGVTFDRFVRERSTAATSGIYVYGRWADTRMSVRFNGSAIRWYGPRQPSYGKAEVYLDGSLMDAVDCYASVTDKAQDAMIWEVSDLAEGPHTMEVRLTGDKNPASSGSIVVFDRFEVDGSQPYGGGQRIDEADGALLGPWISGQNNTYIGQAYHYSRYNTARFELSFTGTQIAWIGPKTGGYGRARVHIDGVDQGVVSQYGPTGWRERVWESKPLLQGQHTITIVPTGTRDVASRGTNIVIDALDVTP